MAPGMAASGCWLVCWSVCPLLWSRIKYLNNFWDRLPWNLQTFTLPRGWIISTLAIPWLLRHFAKNYKCEICGFWWNVSQLLDGLPWDLVCSCPPLGWSPDFHHHHHQVKISVWFMTKYLQNYWHSHLPQLYFVFRAHQRMLACDHDTLDGDHQEGGEGGNLIFHFVKKQGPPQHY